MEPLRPILGDVRLESGGFVRHRHTLAGLLLLALPIAAPATDLGCGYIVQGVECALFRLEPGWAGAGRHMLADYGGFAPGDWVYVTGFLDPSCVSFCMEGDGCIVQNTIEACPARPPAAAPPVLLRNAMLGAVSPLSQPLAGIFRGSSCAWPYDLAGTLDPFGPDCFATAFDPLDPREDGDDTHMGAWRSGAADPDAGVLTDRTRPLVFYQIDDDPGIGNRLRAVKTLASASVAISY